MFDERGKAEISKVFDNNYEYISVLGEGSYGKAYLVKNKSDKVKINKLTLIFSHCQ